MTEEVNIEIREVKPDAWRNFHTAVDFESDERNFKFDFGVMTKKYGNAYIEYCRAAWAANCGVQSPVEFCEMNANMPMGFFEKKIR